MTAMQMNGLAKILNRYFHRLGILLGTYPWLFILATVAFIIFSMCGFFLFTVEMNFVNLFSVIDSPSMQDQRFIEDTFPTNNHDNFDIRRFSNVRNTNRLIITAKDDGNILKEDVFKEAVELDQLIRKIEFSNSFSHSNKTLTYKDICTTYSNGKCYTNPVLQLARSIYLFERNKHTMKYPFDMDIYSGAIIEFCSSLGGVEVDAGGFMISAKAMALYYFNSPKYEDIITFWEQKMINTIIARNFTYIRVSSLSFNIMGEEMQKTALYAIPYFTYCAIIMGIFAFLACSYGDCVVSKSWVGVVGLVIATLSGISGFGFCQYLGIPCAPPSIAILYVVLGIGMDDVFVLLEAWKRSDPERSVVQRMGETMEHAGPSITISSLTNFICFLIGAVAPLKFSYYFCMYAAVCVVFDYVFTVSVVGAFIVLTARGEARPLHAILCVPFDTAEKLCKNKTLYNLIFYKENSEKSIHIFKPNYFSNKFAEFTTSCTTKTGGRIIIFLVYALYLAGSLWGVVGIKEDFKETDVFFQESYLQDQFKYFYKYFKDYHMRVHLVIKEPLPYWEPKTRELLNNITEEIENLPFMASPLMTESWVRFYGNFIKANQRFLKTDYNNKTLFISTLRNVFLKINPYKSYAHDLAFNDDFTEITASRILMQTATVNGTSDLRFVVNSLRDVIDKYPFKMSVYHPYFWIADHLNKVAWITITSLVSAVFILLFISLIFIPSLKFCLITGYVIVSIQIGVLGLSTLWEVDLNNLTNVSLIISVGFSIDNISHVLSSYYNSKKRGAKAKLLQTFRFVGLPIFYGYATSSIALFALILAKSAVYINIFKVIFTVLTISLAHSIFILPILLYIFDDSEDKDIRPDVVQYSQVPAQITQDSKPIEQVPLSC